MAVGKGSMERAAKTITKAKETEVKETEVKEVKAAVIASPVEEAVLKSVTNGSVSIGDEMPIYYY